MSGMKEWEHLKIPFKEIQIATKNFIKCIGSGGYGPVYEGGLDIHGKHTKVAVKRLHAQFGQGLKEFLTEIQLLSGQQHPNLVSLVGYCDNGKEKIIVYEYAERGSLDRYIKHNSDGTETISWLKRLKICADAARGLDHLHSHVGKHQTIIHRDIKAANILLDHNWVAKISDLGLSKLSLAGLGRSAVISNPCGTQGYCEPEYIITGIVKKESDVYSFGMVLFEVLCGKLCTVIGDDGFLLSATLAKEYYKKNKMSQIVDPRIRREISPVSMTKFATIAFECLHDEREQRPPMDVVTKDLEETLNIQEKYEFLRYMWLKRRVGCDVRLIDLDDYWEERLPRDWEVIISKLDIPHAIYTNKIELFSHLQKGVVFDEGNKLFSINDDGKECVLISATRFLELDGNEHDWVIQRDYLWFSRVANFSYGKGHNIRCQIETSMLSIGDMYAANLVFRYANKPNEDLKQVKLVVIKWKTEESTVSSLHHAELTPDNWYKITMWYFINHGTSSDFDIVLEELSFSEDPDKSDLMIQGIEFQPTKMLEDIEGLKSLSTIDEEHIDDDDEYWEKKSPEIQMADNPFGCTTKKELYHRLCEGFLDQYNLLWLSLCKSTGGTCFMIPATDDIGYDSHRGALSLRLPISESRFGNMMKVAAAEWFSFKYSLSRAMYSPNYIYACYLVFKFGDDHTQAHDKYLFKAEFILDDISQGTMLAYLSLFSMNIPTIKPKNDFGASKIPRIEGLEMPKGYMENLVSSRIEERKDGWMEVMLCKPLHDLEDHKLFKLTLSESIDGNFNGMCIQGIEFRPFL